MIGIEQFKDYYLTRRIGIGGMAEIFRAWKVGEEGFEKLVVIKKLLPHLAGNDEFRTMFLEEARLASQLTHPNIVHVYDLGRHAPPSTANQQYFIAMEYVFGKNLAEIRNTFQEKQLTLSLEYLVRIISGAAAALHYAHERKDDCGQSLHIVHRDVSPQNILISYDGDVKLVDFGIAKALTRSQHTQAGVLKGKLAYMSPEQARGEGIDRRADIYSLGVVFWEFLTGNRLFSGESEASILRKVLEPEIATPASVVPHIGPDLEAMCMQCLAPDPDDRYPTALALAMELESYLRELTTFPGSYSIRDYMHTLFAAEIESEQAQIHEEVQAVRNFVQSGEEAELTQVLDSDPAKTRIAPSTAKKVRSKRISGLLPASWIKLPGKWKTVLALSLGLVLVVGLLTLLKNGRSSSEPEASRSLMDADPVTVPAPDTATDDTRELAAALPEKMPDEMPDAMSGEMSGEMSGKISGGLPDGLEDGMQGRMNEADGETRLIAELRALLEQDNLEELLRRLNQIESGQPWGDPRLFAIRAQAMTREAERIMDEDPRQAYTDLRDVITHVQDYALAELQMGRALTRLELQDEALRAYDRALSLDPGLDVAHYNRGVLLLQEGDHVQAEQAFLRVLQLKPDYMADVLVNLAGCRARDQDMGGAVDYLRQAVEVDPEHEIARLNLERLAP